jgi:hypothetical protein
MENAFAQIERSPQVYLSQKICTLCKIRPTCTELVNHCAHVDFDLQKFTVLNTACMHSNLKTYCTIEVQPMNVTIRDHNQIWI